MRILDTSRCPSRAVRSVVLTAFVLATFAVSCTGTHTEQRLGPPSSTRYTDPKYGWSINVPSSLRLHPFETSASERVSTSGAAVSNFASDAIPYGGGLGSFRSFPATGVMFMLWRNEGGLVGVNSHDDTQLPLSLAGYRDIDPYVGGAEPTPRFRSVIEGGGWFASAVWFGKHASEADRSAIEQVVRSVSFPRLDPNSVSPESEAIVAGEASTYPVGLVTAFAPSTVQGSQSTIGHFGFYLVHGPHGFYAVPMTAQGAANGRTCHVTANPSNVSFSCANGAEWDRFAHATSRPAADNEVNGYWLFVASATISWDGHVLVNEGNSPDSALEAWGKTRTR